MEKDALEAQLAAFGADSRAALNQHPRKQEAHPPARTRKEGPLFSGDSLRGQTFVEQRDRYRRQLATERGGMLVRLEQVLPGRAPFALGDLAEDVVDTPRAEMLRTLEAIEQRGLLRAQLAASPWSDWYWPLYQGVLGARYADPHFPLDSEAWQQKQRYVQQRPASAVVQSGDKDAINRLSPAEKYDLVMGDGRFSLTAASWEEGEQYFKRDGKVERWMGICHGWAPAAYMLKRPTKAVQVLAADGKTLILFYPSDLKALGSLLWARGAGPVRFVGGRCNDKDAATDDVGRVVSDKCFDTNPGTWHLAVVNQIGVSRRSLIIDATFDYEVWNQPVYAYEYTYFNPQTRKAARTLAEAKVALSAFGNDRFAKHRSRDARSLVGVGMKLTYVAETMPSDERSDSPDNDYRKAVNYVYDLELNDAGAIVGGEWYQNAHPDFLWTPGPDSAAGGPFDQAASGQWTDDTAPEGWRKAAVSASESGQPLARLVGALFGWAH